MRVMRICGTFYFKGGFMAQYDGSIRINTKILIDEAKKKLSSFSGNVSNFSKTVSSKMDLLRSKMNLGWKN